MDSLSQGENMSINAIAGYAHAYGLGSFGFSNSLSAQGPLKGSMPLVSSLSQPSQNAATQTADDGDDPESAFLGALQQIAQQYNLTLSTASGSTEGSAQATSASTTPSSGTTASGSGGTPTSSTASSATDATSTTSTQTVRPHHHHRHGGSFIDNSDGGEDGQTSASAGLGAFFNLSSQTSGTQNPSLASFLTGQPGASASGASSSLISQLSSQSGLTVSQANAEIGAVLSNLSGNSGSVAAGSTTGATSAAGSSSTTSPVAALSSTPNTLSELTSLLGSSSSLTAGGGFGAWAQGIEQNMLSAFV